MIDSDEEKPTQPKPTSAKMTAIKQVAAKAPPAPTSLVTKAPPLAQDPAAELAALKAKLADMELQLAFAKVQKPTGSPLSQKPMFTPQVSKDSLQASGSESGGKKGEPEATPEPVGSEPEAANCEPGEEELALKFDMSREEPWFLSIFLETICAEIGSSKIIIGLQIWTLDHGNHFCGNR